MGLSNKSSRLPFFFFSLSEFRPSFVDLGCRLLIVFRLCLVSAVNNSLLNKPPGDEIGVSSFPFGVYSVFIVLLNLTFLGENASPSVTLTGSREKSPLLNRTFLDDSPVWRVKFGVPMLPAVKLKLKLDCLMLALDIFNLNVLCLLANFFIDRFTYKTLCPLLYSS